MMMVTHSRTSSETTTGMPSVPAAKGGVGVGGVARTLAQHHQAVVGFLFGFLLVLLLYSTVSGQLGSEDATVRAVTTQSTPAVHTDQQRARPASPTSPTTTTTAPTTATATATATSIPSNATTTQGNNLERDDEQNDAEGKKQPASAAGEDRNEDDKIGVGTDKKNNNQTGEGLGINLCLTRSIMHHRQHFISFG
ncbi:hypothetical protein GUJ93_ZPchr0006g43587 [Zizania palustris]|uniref:Uncharacterized protein n=1 Tax=Zizania palustris TaxID=103762 RepID=A0A8J5T920_ZIZPA|nr:hypothetical protein GUJ93_ZPchr0006g43587 [Zizania palustris]